MIRPSERTLDLHLHLKALRGVLLQPEEATTPALRQAVWLGVKADANPPPHPRTLHHDIQPCLQDPEEGNTETH